VTAGDRRAVAFALDALVDLDRPADPAAAVAAELRERGVGVSGDWPEVYRETAVDAPEGAAVPRQARVSKALRRAGVDPTDGDRGEGNVVRRAVVAAVDPAVGTEPGAAAAVAAAADRGPVGVLADVAVPGLARRALVRSGIDRGDVDAVVTAAGCGWHPPHRGAFEALADRLGVDGEALVYVGADPRVADGEGEGEGVAAVGGTPLVVDPGGTSERADARTLSSLRAVPAWLDGR
jgi:hypothetical protein